MCRNSDSTSFKETRSYDKDNNRIDLFHYLSDGHFKFKNTASYDDKGRVIELDWYWPTGLNAKNYFIYEGENLKEKIENSPQGELLCTWEYKHDKDNNLTEEVQYKPGGKTGLYKRVYFFGNNHQLLKQSFYANDALQNSQTYEYDTNGLMTSKNDFNPFGKITQNYRYHYEYFK